MDKKKVKELLEQILNYCYQGYDPYWQSKSIAEFTKLGNISRISREAIKELSKSDWVSVEDDLPDYDEVVLVTDEDNPDDMWFGHRTADRSVVVDEHEFAKGYGTITHWQRVEPLKREITTKQEKYESK